MQSILFVYSDSRVASVVDALRELTRVPITVASDFDSGLQEIFEKRPAQIFIQEEIGGTSCVAVAGHIKNLLRDSAPRIVLLRDDPGRRLVAGRDNFDDSIDLSGLTDDLLAEIRLRLEGMFGMQWREDVRPPEADTVEYAVFDEAAVERAAAELMAGGNDEPLALASSLEAETALPVEDLPDLPPADHFAPVEPFVLPVASEPVPDLPPEPVMPVAEPAPLPVQSPSPTRVETAPVAVPSPEPVATTQEAMAAFEADDELFRLEDALASRSKRQQRSRFYAVGLLVFVALVAGWFFLGRTPPKPAMKSAPPVPIATTTPAPAPPSTVAPPAVSVAPLPPALAMAPIDPSYGERKPGWERRTAADFDVLVFRENGTVRALQVVAKSSNGLADPVVAAVFQFAGGTAVVWQKEEQRGGFLVEQGMLPSRHEILRYTRPGVKSPAALVVAVP